MLTDSEKRVLTLIDQGRDDIVKFLAALIGFKTVSPLDGESAKGDDFQKHQDFVSETLKELGFGIDRWEADARELESSPGAGVDPSRDLSNMPIVAGRRPGAGKGRSLILNGHYDVVPPGLRENWTSDPFEAVVRDGNMYGRGANDMKGGIAAMIQAVRFILKAGVEPGGEIIVQTVPDEEASCMGTLSCCQRGYKADAAVIPEPTGMKVMIAMRGNAGGSITVFGRAGHAELAQPHWSKGGAVNAISKAAKIIQGLEELAEEWRTRPDKQHKLLDPDTIMPTIIEGGEWAVTYPEKVEITYDAVFIPTTKNLPQEIAEKVRRVAECDPWMRENPPRLESIEWEYGAEISEDEPIAQLGLEALGELGLEPGFMGFGSLSDGIHLINYSKVPTISIGPSLKTAHMANELVSIEELVNTTKAIALIIMRWCR
jgi:acetylornithine deacetylase